MQQQWRGPSLLSAGTTGFITGSHHQPVMYCCTIPDRPYHTSSAALLVLLYHSCWPRCLWRSTKRARTTNSPGESERGGGANESNLCLLRLVASLSNRQVASVQISVYTTTAVTIHHRQNGHQHRKPRVPHEGEHVVEVLLLRERVHIAVVNKPRLDAIYDVIQLRRRLSLQAREVLRGAEPTRGLNLQGRRFRHVLGNLKLLHGRRFLCASVCVGALTTPSSAPTARSLKHRPCFGLTKTPCCKNPNGKLKKGVPLM